MKYVINFANMKYLIFSFLLLLSQLSVAQNNTYSYLGALLLNNNKPISFSLELIEKDGIVNGYSITNIGTKDETKSEISGLYFDNNNSFQLQETQILSTTSESPLNTFCYINMVLSFKGKFNKKRLEGTFTGNFLDSTECANGKILLMEKKKIEKKIKKVTTKIQKEIEKQNIDTNQILQTQILKDGDEFSINWENNKLKLYIWDPNIEDGDEIELKINNKILLRGYETKKKRKKIKFRLKEGENIIEITALNSGSKGKNTSRIELVDNKIKYPIMSDLQVGKTAIIKVIK